MLWILENMRLDNEEQEAAMSKASNPNATRTTVENEDFDTFVRDLVKQRSKGK